MGTPGKSLLTSRVNYRLVNYKRAHTRRSSGALILTILARAGKRPKKVYYSLDCEELSRIIRSSDARPVAR